MLGYMTSLLRYIKVKITKPSKCPSKQVLGLFAAEKKVSGVNVCQVCP